LREKRKLINRIIIDKCGWLRMKILILYTSYRQYKEFNYQARFLEKCPKLVSQSDMIVACNNMDMPRAKLEQKLLIMPFHKKKLAHVDRNRGKYLHGGGYDLVASQEEDMSSYDFVIQLHPDLYFTDEEPILRLLHRHKDDKIGFFVSRVFGNKARCFATDFFICRPKYVPKGFFLQCLMECLNRIPDPGDSEAIFYPTEAIFYSIMHELNVPYLEVPRFPLGKTHCDIDELGMWHEHQFSRLDLFFKYPPLMYALGQCASQSQPLFLREAYRYIRHSIYGKQQDNFLKRLSRAGERSFDRSKAILTD
jgi:hypothetical protein